MEFKVGDKGRCIKELPCFTIMKKGDKHIIKRIVGRKLMFEINNQNRWYTEDLFELVKEKKKEEVWTGEKLNNIMKFGIDAYKCIFNDKATILFYKSSLDYIPIERKVVAKCQEGDKFTKEDGLRICVLKAMKREIERELKQY